LNTIMVFEQYCLVDMEKWEEES
jgi:hypothetical protein